MTDRLSQKGRVIAAINMTLDGNCDHTAGIVDEELHRHYTDLLKCSNTILYGRITYQLMEFWRTILDKPTGEKSMDEFAVAIDEIHKIVFSRTLDNVEWDTASIAEGELADVVKDLKENAETCIFVGSPGLIVSLSNLGLIDEYQICIHPVLAGKGLTLFEEISGRTELRLLGTEVFESGSVVLSYERKDAAS